MKIPSYEFQELIEGAKIKELQELLFELEGRVVDVGKLGV